MIRLPAGLRLSAHRSFPQFARCLPHCLPGALGQRSAFMADDAFRRRPWVGLADSHSGCVFSTDTADLIQRSIAVFGRWEPEVNSLIRHCLTPHDTFIDIGANIGYHAVTVAAARPTSSVVAIEPLPRAYEQLKANVGRNRLTNVRTSQTCIATERGHAVLAVARLSNIGGSTMVREVTQPVETVSVQTAKLCEALSPDEVATARVVKIDVEGAEPAVVASLASLLPRMRDDLDIIAEISPAWTTRDDIAEIFALLHDFGYDNMYAVDWGYCRESLSARASYYTAPRLLDLPRRQQNVFFTKTSQSFLHWPRGLS